LWQVSARRLTVLWDSIEASSQDDDEPERIFQQAIRFHQAQKILERSPDDQREALVQPVCVLAAFTTELLLKCLIRIKGGSPPRDHDLLELFKLLSAPTRERLAAMWSDYVQHRGEAFEQVGVTIEPELTSALAAGRKGFEVIRYWREEPEEDCVFYLTALPTMLFTVAFELRPNWAEPC
jgi:HEPN domain-containing protein